MTSATVWFAQSDWAKDAGHDPPGFHAPILHPPAKLVTPKFLSINAFTHWREILNFAPIAHALRQAYTNAIEAYLDCCRRKGLSVAVGTARDFMADATRRGLAKDPASWKKGLNWFFTTGRKTSGPLPPGVPSLRHADTEQTNWERRPPALPVAETETGQWRLPGRKTTEKSPRKIFSLGQPLS